jgi:hypothetical protein
MSSASNPPQEVIDLTVGPLVTGIWIQQLLLGFILAQMVDYYRTQFAKDDATNKLIVTMLLILNLLLGGTDLYVVSSLHGIPFLTAMLPQSRHVSIFGYALRNI